MGILEVNIIFARVAEFVETTWDVSVYNSKLCSTFQLKKNSFTKFPEFAALG